ncbi:rifamycin-inactivating phosphotransferase [Taibaiella koreensis]|uniref:rifamycin-inactivating phosphotransferase n=1 Tax=Taibaiella koreensis TaxID=1268548 RepID=UPI000E599A6B|nr:rifamycin-inactivating phosphotransferase [Taibaiella koreensis]
MNTCIFDLKQLDRTKLAIAGGKGANLGELCHIEGIQVPAGFCISTAAYQQLIESNSMLKGLLDELAALKPAEGDSISTLSAKIRAAIESAPIPPALAGEIGQHLERLGRNSCYAVRSSATAEDLPTASFAGQQDSYLNICGEQAILEQVRRCWASLFTERAVIYRLQNGFDHRKVYLSVIVQRMVFPGVSGILFTADPVTGNRKVTAIDASFGLGESLVSGRVNADHYKVRDGRIPDKKTGDKKIAIYAAQKGGTQEVAVEPEQQHTQALTDEQILQLTQIGRKIEAHFGYPQDIEWCRSGNVFYIVQSRPITTLYPVPEANDTAHHVYVSVGHQQMMTDAMKPLGLSLWQLTAHRPMYEAGGRLFVDVAPDLASASGREMLVNVLGKSDPLIKAALTTIIERDDLIPLQPGEEQKEGAGQSAQSRPDFQAQIEYDPVIVPGLIQRRQEGRKALQQDISKLSGPALIDFILEDRQRLRASLSDKESFAVIMTAMNAAWWLNEHIENWLGEKNVADILAQSVPGNVTSEMGLALLDVADVIRPYPEVVAYLQQAKEDHFLDGMLSLEGGRESRKAIDAFLDQYGMRCAGEIDITRTRWREQPAILAPLILNNVRNAPSGEGRRRFEQGLQEASKKEQELLVRLALLPDGEEKARETKRMIDLLRHYAGYREYPKYDIVSRYFIYKLALLKEARDLVQAGVLREQEDIYYLTFAEFREVLDSHRADHQLIAERKEAFRHYEKLSPPRVMTSEGERIAGAYKREDLPGNAIAGLAVSSGMAEGRARVILDMKDADIEEGDILVTTFTDPSWTPLFVSLRGLVTEVGGLMTHGAVIAREYGLPAVVSVENATRLIRDGQRIRVHGTEGYVELL